jgi:hypothetical protein
MPPHPGGPDQPRLIHVNDISAKGFDTVIVQSIPVWIFTRCQKHLGLHHPE